MSHTTLTVSLDALRDLFAVAERAVRAAEAAEAARAERGAPSLDVAPSPADDCFEEETGHLDAGERRAIEDLRRPLARARRALGHAGRGLRHAAANEGDPGDTDLLFEMRRAIQNALAVLAAPRVPPRP